MVPAATVLSTTISIQLWWMFLQMDLERCTTSKLIYALLIYSWTCDIDNCFNFNVSYLLRRQGLPNLFSNIYRLKLLCFSYCDISYTCDALDICGIKQIYWEQHVIANKLQIINRKNNMKERKNQYIFKILISIHIQLRIIERRLFNKDCLDVASESDFMSGSYYSLSYWPSCPHWWPLMNPWYCGAAGWCLSW